MTRKQIVRFEKRLKEAADTVATWPLWKRVCLGLSTASELIRNLGE